MSHLTDDDLVLHYYGEDGLSLAAAERHLQSCAPCAGAYAALHRTLDAVTPPEAVEPGDDLQALRRLLRERTSAPSTPVLALVWLAPALYPFSLQVLFNSGRLAQEHPAALPLVVLALLWACAGPFVALLALHRMPAGGFEGRATRALVSGAVCAAVSPALFLLVSRLGTLVSPATALWPWFAALAAASLTALVPWPRVPDRSAPFITVHRVSALLLAAYVLAHVVNQAIAFVSVPLYTAMRNVMRVASDQPALYAVVVAAVVTQMATGVAVGMRRVRPGAVAANLQAVSGWCLGAFLLMHVFTGVIASLTHTAAPVSPATATAATPFNLLASARAAAQLPFLLLGVAAFLFHLGIYGRLAALAYLAEAPVRRLSYAAVVAGTTVVVTVGLALCGVHLIR